MWIYIDTELIYNIMMLIGALSVVSISYLGTYHDGKEGRDISWGSILVCILTSWGAIFILASNILT